MFLRFLVVLHLGCLVAVLPASAQNADHPVRLRFAAVVGAAPLGCGVKYEDIGTSRSVISVADFRFYVSRLRLLKSDGSEQPVTLTQDGLWQLDDVALLDFENGTAACANGTEQMRDVIEGQVPEAKYVGVRFDLGLPFEKNHVEPTLQPSPLNLTRMFWSWNAGYKFLRLDLRSTGLPKGWMLHLGSTGCTPAGTPTIPAVNCARPNIVTVDLPAFDVATDVVELDLKALLAKSDVDTNTPKTAEGCMSGLSDPECGPLLSQFGLVPGEGQPAVQTVFRVRRTATAAQPR
jgi:uncharacterized repeat protein (TIGR04052 family)